MPSLRIPKTWMFWALPMLLAGWSGAHSDEAQRERIEFFERRIRPLLVENCQRCHSGEKPKATLRLDDRDGLLKGGERGPAVVAGKPAASLLVKAIGYQDPKLRMPPSGKLSDAQIAYVTAWTKMGAPWPDDRAARKLGAGRQFDLKERAQHWSLQPLRNVPLPAVRHQYWPQSPIDNFILSALEARDLAPAPPADRRTLLRRVTFDLIGLPPKAAEIDAFLADDSPEAFTKVVDRLLDSPHYGERWARHWLDLVRYAETCGHELDADIPDAWRYRDYVIRAFNADVPYDQLVLEHIAGDLLPGPRRHQDGTNESILGTGFFWLGEAAHAPAEARKDQAERIDNQIDVIGKAFLGLTVACARCHDHKLDAISTRDYYALAGYLQSTRMQPGPARGLAAADSSPVNAHVFLGGDPKKLGEVVPRRFLEVFGGAAEPAASGGSGRLELARHMLDPFKTPIVPRVLVNRLWQHHFGEGIVRSPDDFGVSGEPPTHPELLDYLAGQLIKHGWSIKHMHRLMLPSSTYQMASRAEMRSAASDPDNKLWHRMPVRRLEAEAIRDAMLAVSGRLDSALFGPSVPPHLTPSMQGHGRPAASGPLDGAGRRSIYLNVRRNFLSPMLLAFDYPTPLSTMGRRNVSNTLAQGQILMNDPFVRQQAELWAKQVLADPKLSPRQRFCAMYVTALGRPPTEPEVGDMLTLLDKQRPGHGSAEEVQLWRDLCLGLFRAREFIFVD